MNTFIVRSLLWGAKQRDCLCLSKKLARVAACVLLGAGLRPNLAVGQTPIPAAARDTAAQAAAAPAPGLAGLWKGPLAIPGGSLLIQITITQTGPNQLSATLDLPAKRMNRIPASLTKRGDSLFFYAPTADCRFVGRRSADGQEWRGQWVQPGLRVPLSLHRTLENVAPASPGGKAASVFSTKYHTEPVTITVQPGDVRLAGTLSIPDGPGPFPAALLLSDMGPQDRDARRGDYRLFADMAVFLARQGVAVLRLDDRGVGQSGGSGLVTTTAELVRDAQAGLNYLRLRPTLDPARIGLIGHGEGGNVALLAAGQPVPPAFVVTLAAAGLPGQELLASQPEPAAPADTARAGAARRQAWADVLAKAAKLRTSGSNAAQVETYVSQQRLKIKSEERKQAEAMFKFRRAMFEIVRQTASNDQAQSIVVNMLRQRHPDLDPATVRTRATELTTPWYRFYLKFDPLASLAQVQCPVLLLQGTDDAEVNAAANLQALEKGLKANKRLTTVRLPGVSHWFQAPTAGLLPSADGTVDPLVSLATLTAVRDWIEQQAGK